MDGASIPGPWRYKTINAECLEFLASCSRNRIADELPESNVLAAILYRITTHYPVIILEL